MTNNASFLCTLHSYDANGQAANLANWQQEYDQLSHGRFIGIIKEINFRHIHIFREDTNRALRQQCRVEEGGLWLGFSANRHFCRINNEAVAASDILCRPGNLDFELITPEHFSIYGVVLHKSMFEQPAFQNQMEMTKTRLDSLWLKHVPTHTLHRFRQYLALLLQQGERRWSDKTQETILQDAIAELLEHTNKEDAHRSHINTHQRQRIMARVYDYLSDSRLRSPVTISELCASIHISRRTLQYTFASCCNLSPKQFIHITRLNQIRREFQTSSEYRTVSDTAFDFGFFHLGQFCHDYKRLFGETPLQTMKQHKVTH